MIIEFKQAAMDGSYPMANRDFHTMYVGEIVDAYIIR